MRVNPSFKPSLISGLWVGNEFGNGGDFRVLGGLGMRVCCGGGGFGGGERGYRKVRKKFVKSKRKVKDLELSVKILIEEGLPNDPEVLVIFFSYVSLIFCECILIVISYLIFVTPRFVIDLFL